MILCVLTKNSNVIHLAYKYIFELLSYENIEIEKFSTDFIDLKL